MFWNQSFNEFALISNNLKSKNLNLEKLDLRIKLQASFQSNPWWLFTISEVLRQPYQDVEEKGILFQKVMPWINQHHQYLTKLKTSDMEVVENTNEYIQINKIIRLLTLSQLIPSETWIKTSFWIQSPKIFKQETSNFTEIKNFMMMIFKKWILAERAIFNLKRVVSVCLLRQDEIP